MWTIVASLAVAFTIPDDKGLVEAIARANQALLDPAVSLEIHYEVSRLSPVNGVFTLYDREAHHYWRKFPFIRAKMDTSSYVLDRLLGPDAGYSLMSQKNIRSSQGSIFPAAPNEFFLHWIAGYQQLVPFPPSRFALPLHEALLHPQVKVGVSSVREGGRQWYRLTLDYEAGRYEVVVDPDRNFLPIKGTMGLRKSADQGMNSAYEVTETQEIAPGVFFPRTATTRAFTDGRETHRVEYLFTEVKYRQAMPDSLFTWVFPGGIHVSDSMKGQILKTNSQGVPALPAVSPEGVPQLLQSKNQIAGSSRLPPVRQMTATFDEPSHWSDWFLPLACVLLGSAGILWYWKRRHASAIA